LDFLRENPYLTSFILTDSIHYHDNMRRAIFGKRVIQIIVILLVSLMMSGSFSSVMSTEMIPQVDTDNKDDFQNYQKKTMLDKNGNKIEDSLEQMISERQEDQMSGKEIKRYNLFEDDIEYETMTDEKYNGLIKTRYPNSMGNPNYDEANFSSLESRYSPFVNSTYNKKPLSRDEILTKTESENNGYVSVIVSYEDSTYPRTVDYSNLGAKIKYRYTIVNAVALEIPKENLVKLSKTPGVDMVYQDHEVKICLDSSTSVINASQTTAHYGLRGDGVTIAIIDTGIDASHPSLDDMDDDPTTDDPKVIGFYDVINNPDITDGTLTPYDDHGHGTHCAAIAAGTGGGTNYVGVAPTAKLVGVKVLSWWGYGEESGIIAGIEWCIQNKATYNISIISMSLGANVNSDGTSPLEVACDNAVAAGISVVVAAGNAGPSSNTVGIPACAFNVTTVGAIDDSMNIASFSSRGPTLDGRIKPDVCAVGVSVTSAQANTNGYVTWQGTSMATPHVAGVYALLLEYNPSLSPSQLKQIIKESAVDKGDAGPDNTYGWGVVDSMNAVNYVAPVAHSIIVVNIDAPLSAEVNETIFVNSTIRNLGSNSETNIIVDFLVNTTIQNTTTIDFIQNGTSTNVSFSWKPTVAGEIYKIGIYAHPVPDENQICNNLRKKLVVVPLDWVVTGKETVTDQTITVVGNLTVQSGGNLTLNNVGLFLTSVVDGQFGIYVENGGFLYIYNATILPFYPLYMYKFAVYGNMAMVNCNVSYMWGVEGGGGDLSTSGLSIHSDNVSVLNSTVSYCKTVGIGCYASPFISGNKIMYNGNNNDCRYGGVYCAPETSPIISNNTFIDNKESNIYSGGYAAPKITNNTIISGINPTTWFPTTYYGIYTCLTFIPDVPVISNNSIIGTRIGVYCWGSSPRVIYNNISKNILGIYAPSSDISPFIAYNTLTNNEGVGISCGGGAVIQNNTISGSGFGIVCYYPTDSLLITNNTITKNTYGISCGGGWYECFSNCWYTNATIMNNTIVNNYYGVLSYYSFLTLVNNRIGNNDAWGLFSIGESTDLTNNIFEDEFGKLNGEGNIWQAWSLRAQVNKIDDSPLNSTPIFIKDRFGEIGTFEKYGLNVDLWTTDETGYAYMPITEYKIYNNGTNVSYIPHKVCVWGEKTGFGSDTIVTMDRNQKINIVLNVPEPYQGNLTITDQQTWENNVIILDGNLTVANGGSLTLNNSTLIVYCNEYGEHEINVATGGVLHISNSTITTYRILLPDISSYSMAYRYKFKVYGNMSMSRCTIMGMWGHKEYLGGGWYLNYQDGGIQIFSDNVSISESYIGHSLTSVIYYDGCSPTIINNTIRSSEYGICSWYTTGGLISGTTGGLISGNEISGSVVGINCEGSSSTICNNKITNNLFGGIWLDSSSPPIMGNTISNNGAWGIMFSSASTFTTTIFNNTITKNYGDGIYCVSDSLIKNNTIQDNDGIGIICGSCSNSTVISNNTIGNNDLSGIFCSQSSPIIENNTLSNNKDWDGVTCVDGSNPMIFNNTISSNGDMGIWCNRSSSPTILQNTIVDNKRYGVFCGNSSSPIVTRNNITLNEWGVVCEDFSYSSPFIGDNFIVNNNKTHYTDGLMDGQGGIYIGSKTSPTVVNNTITGFHFYGIYCYNPSPPIENPIVNNKLLGDYWSADPLIINNTLLNNYWSFVFYYASNVTVENCNVSSNLAASAGVIVDSSNSIIFINSTINTYHTEWSTRDLWLYSKSNITLINTTFNKTKICWGDQSSTLTVGWYLNVKVTDKNSIPIPDVAIVVYNSSDAEIYNEGTNLGGWAKDIVCIEKIQTATESTMHTPHNITVSKEQYFTNYTSIMMNASKDIVIVLEHLPNNPPVIQSYHPETNPTITEEETQTFNIIASDPDTYDVLIISWYLNGTLVPIPMETAPAYIFEANYTSAGWYEVKVVVSDGELSVEHSWILTVTNVNREPVIDSYSPTYNPTITEEETQIFTVTTSDPDGDMLTVEWYLNNTLVDTDTSYTFIGNYASAGSYEIKVVVFDGDLHANHTWTLTVTNVNRAPILTNPLPDKSFDEDHTLLAFSLNDYFSDPDGEKLTYTVSGNNHVSVIINPDGTVNLSASENWYGNETITFRATDPYNEYVEDTIIVAVNPVNDAPIISGLSDQPLMEDVTFWYDITPYISDVDNDISDLVVSTNSSYITVHNSNHTLEMTYPNGITVDYVRITVSDGILSDYEDVIFTITPVNDAPTISGIPAQYATEDTDLYLDISPYINDVDNSTDELTVSANSSYATVNGFMITFNYPNGILSENVRITVSDGINASHQDIMVIVTPVNDAPVINSFTPVSNPVIDEGEQQVFTVSASDVDNTDLIITWYLDDNPVGTGNTYTFTSDYNSAGTYTVKAVVSDGSLADEKIWTLTVDDVKKQEKGFIPGFETAILLAALICILLYRKYRIE